MVKWDDLEMSSWWDSETQEFQTFVLRLLASLPFGEEAEDAGFEPFTNALGWQEMVMVTEMLDKIQDKNDVMSLISEILYPEGLDDEE